MSTWQVKAHCHPHIKYPGKENISTRRRWASVAVTGYTDDDSGQSCSPWDLGRRLPHHFHRKSPTMCNHPMLCCRTLFYSFYCNMFMGLLFLEECIIYKWQYNFLYKSTSSTAQTCTAHIQIWESISLRRSLSPTQACWISKKTWETCQGLEWWKDKRAIDLSTKDVQTTGYRKISQENNVSIPPPARHWRESKK